MDSIYLSPGLPRLPVASEQDLVRAVSEGLLEENHFLDLKRELKSGRSQNRETARDLAQFAVDGGTVIVGIEELEDGTLQLVPQPLAGLPEKVEQIAATAVDPPLAVITHAIPTTDDPSVGYLVINVPASPSAPYMVESRYLGRGDKTKRYLTDPEVVRLHATRSARELSGIDLLHKEVERDIFKPPSTNRQAHGFFVAQPLAGRPDMMLALTDGDLDAFQGLVNTAIRLSNARLAGVNGATRFSPDLNDMGNFDRRPASLARTTYEIGAGRTIRNEAGYRNRDSGAEFELQDDGGIRIYTARLSAHLRELEGEAVIDAAAVVFAHRMIALAQGVADRAGYLGSWVLAFGANRLRGACSGTLAQAWRTEGRYPDDTYERAVTASYADLSARPNELVDQLVGRLLRGLQSRREFLPALTTPPSGPILDA